MRRQLHFYKSTKSVKSVCFRCAINLWSTNILVNTFCLHHDETLYFYETQYITKKNTKSSISRIVLNFYFEEYSKYFASFVRSSCTPNF